jgi:hypothetical protein
MALLPAGSLQEAIADRDLAPRDNLGVNAHANMAESALKAGTMSRSLSAVARLTWAGAHRVIGEITRSRTAGVPDRTGSNQAQLQNAGRAAGTRRV